MNNYYPFILLLLAFLYSGCQSPDTGQNDSSPSADEGLSTIPVKVVVISMFENGEDTGDQPGEFQFWVERLPLDSTISFPQGYRDLRYNAEKQVLGICTGMGTSRSAASIMALGMDPRFDLSRAYWMVAGISGIDPRDGSTGSAVWAEWLVDGDLAYEIDPRDVPEAWNTGYIPLGKTEPYEKPAKEGGYNTVYHLNPDLVDWAYQKTKGLELEDNETIQKMRAQYVNFPKAQKPPRVMKGDHLAGMTYWHGARLNEWANRWVSYWTKGEGNFVTSAMEDTGTGQALEFLDQAGRADFDRYMVLRTASNFTMEYAGITAVQSLTNEGHGEGETYSAYIPSLEAAYRTGKVVVDSLVTHWDKYDEKIPQP